MRIGICLSLALLLLILPGTGLWAEDTPPPADAGPQRAEFDKLFEQWKGLLADLRILQVDYRGADAQKRAEIRGEWDQMIEKGKTMEPELVKAAEKAFVEAPNTDQDVRDLLVSVLKNHIHPGAFKAQSEDYEEAMRLGTVLIENQCADKQIYDPTGIAAFVLNDFDSAEKYLKLAEEAEMVSDQGRTFLASTGQYKTFWAKEQQIRQAEAQADDLPRVLMKTSQGDIEIELFENEAPIAVANFISLVESKFYDGLTFHRVLAGFMAQGGCPKGDGTGGPGYHIPCECYQPNHRLHFRGSLSMAHSGRDTGGSQFFLTFVPTSHLDGKHTVFGRMIRGFEVLHKLRRRDPSKPGAPEPDKIIEVTVLRKRPHEYVPKKVGE